MKKRPNSDDTLRYCRVGPHLVFFPKLTNIRCVKNTNFNKSRKFFKASCNALPLWHNSDPIQTLPQFVSDDAIEEKVIYSNSQNFDASKSDRIREFRRFSKYLSNGFIFKRGSPKMPFRQSPIFELYTPKNTKKNIVLLQTFDCHLSLAKLHKPVVDDSQHVIFQRRER